MKKNFLGLILIISLLFIPKIAFADSTKDRIHFISSTSEGDSMIIESNGHFGLIDALDETNGIKVKNYADALGVDHFDFVIMTHNHHDSIGGIPALASLFNSDTLVFYKEDLTTTDDYEEVVLNLQNNYYFGLALQTFNGSKKCDVTKASLLNDSACYLSTLSNSYISSVLYDDADDVEYNPNVKENLSFNFGDFNISLYSLYSLSYHLENLNSIVTVVEHNNTGVRAALTADIEASVGDDNYAELVGRSNLIDNPTEECDLTENPECTNSSIETQIALLIGSVDLLKAANHGDFSSNSFDAINIYSPSYYILSSGSKSNTVELEFSYLKNFSNTESYLSSQTQGALVAEFSDLDNVITIKNFDTTATDTETALIDMGASNFTNGWHSMIGTGFGDEERGYAENGQFVKDIWKDLEVNSVTYTYHFDKNGIMTTGFYIVGGVPEEPETPETPEEPDDGEEGDESGGDESGGGETTPEEQVFYFCESDTNPACELGSMQTGLISAYEPLYGDYYKFYFKPVTDSEGEKGEMVTGLVNIGGYNYYFRTEDNEVFAGPKGSALINGCIQFDPADSTTRMCFDFEGKETQGNVPTPIPTEDLCNGAIYELEEDEEDPGNYNSVEQSITYAPEGGYTWTNNIQKFAGDYTVTAVLDDNYYWYHEDDQNNTSDTADKTITCTLETRKIVDPVLGEDSFVYTGSAIEPEFIFIEPEYVSLTGNTSETDVGTYTIEVHLSDQNNTEWADETDVSEAKEYEWSISSTQWATPAVSSETFTYDGQPHSIEASSAEGGTLEYSTDGTNWSTTKPTITTVSESPLTIKVRVRGDSSHATSEVAEATVVINKNFLTKPTIPDSSIAYTGSEITATMSDFDTNTMIASGDLSGTNAGTYSITVAIRDTANYAWSDNSISALALTWNITKASTENPIVTSYGPLPYDGQPHTVTATGDGTLEYSENSNGPWSTTPITRTNAGTTTVYVRVKEDSNHLASLVSNGVIVIEKAKVTTPSITTSSYAYNGSSISPVINNYDEDIMELSGDTSATNVGDYEVTIALKNTDNYEWMDETIAAITQVWSITKQKLSAPSITNYNGTYDGNSHTITVSGTGTIKYSTDGTTWGDVLPTMTDVGTTTVYAKTIGDTNHEDSDVATGTITITKANISAPSVTNYSEYYDGNPHTITVSPVSIGTLKYSIDNGSTWLTTAPTRTEVGITTVKVKVFGNSNYNDSETVTGTIEIKQDSTYEIKDYIVDETNKYINKIIVGTDLETFKSHITLGSGYTVVVDTKTIDGTKYPYTGGKTKIIYNGEVIAEYTNIVIGDTNGDGRTDSADLLRVKQHLLGNKLLTGVYFIASDINYDSRIDSADLLRIKQHLLGTRYIN